MKDLLTPTAAAENPVQGRGPSPADVVIIGGGASGVLMAVHLLRQGGSLRVTLIEGRGALGAGIAYATTDPEHLLNTRVHNMSAFPDDPQHFHRWLVRRPDSAKVSDQGFVSRSTYGTYLAELLADWQDDPRLMRVFQEVIGLNESDAGVVVHLANGQVRIANRRARTEKLRFPSRLARKAGTSS